QAKSGDTAGAKKTFFEAEQTATLIHHAFWKKSKQKAIAEAQAKAGITNAPHSTPPSTANAQPQPRSQPVITVADWLGKLDDDNKSHDCPLNTEPFLDLASYLKSLPPSDTPQKVFASLHEAATKIVKAQNVLAGLLKQQAG